MTWQVIARKDIRYVLGERLVKLLLLLLAVVILIGAYIYPLFGDEPITTAGFSGFIDGWLTTVIPLLGIVLGYDAIVRDRQSGALYLTLSLPHTRRDIVLGSMIARTGMLAIAIIGAMGIAGILVVYPFGDLELLAFLAFVALTLVFGAIWTGIGIAVSIIATTKQRALILGIGIFIVFATAWDGIRDGFEFALNSAGVIDGNLPNVVEFFFALEPGQSFERVIAGFIDPGGIVDGPWYLGEWVALVILALWLLIPLPAAYHHFASGDLS